MIGIFMGRGNALAVPAAVGEGVHKQVFSLRLPRVFGGRFFRLPLKMQTPLVCLYSA